MSIVLHRFPLSHFSEKARLLLDFKGLDYELRDHQLGLPQLAIYRLSGQRKLPVIEHDGHVVSDSTRIAHYLDEQFPDTRRLVPRDDPRRSEVLDLEERIDRKFGVGPVARWLEHCLDHQDHLDLLAIETHGLPVLGARGLGALVRALRGPVTARTARFVEATYALLDDLTARLRRGPYLVGDEPTLADLAAAGLLFHLEFPTSRYLWDPAFAGRGVPEAVARFPEVFLWRRKLYTEFLR